MTVQETEKKKARTVRPGSSFHQLITRSISSLPPFQIVSYLFPRFQVWFCQKDGHKMVVLDGRVIDNVGEVSLQASATLFEERAFSF